MSETPFEPEQIPGGDAHKAPSIKLDKASASNAVVWSMLYAFISKIIFPLGGIYITGVLGPEQIGIFLLLMTIVNFSEVLRDAGLTQSYLAEPEMNKRKEAAYFGVAIISGLVPSLVLVASAGWFANFFAIRDLIWAIPAVAGVVFLNGLSTISRAKMLKDGQIRLSGLYEVISGAVGLATAIMMVRMGFGFVSMLTNFALVAVLGLIVNWIRYPVLSCSLSIEAFRIVGKRSLAVLAANGINNLFLFADQTVINKFAGVAANGYFGAATNLAYKPMELFVFPLTRTLMVAFSQSVVDQERLNRIYARSLTLALLVVAPIYVVLAVFAQPILYLFWQDKFMNSVPVLQAMSLYIGMRVFGNISGYALVPAGKHFQTLYVWIIGALVTATSLFWVVRSTPKLPMIELLMPVVWCFVGGAVAVYGSILFMGIHYCPPAAEQKKKLFEAIAVLVVSSIAILGVRFLPIAWYGQLFVVGLVGPVLHLMVIGTILEKKPLYYVRPSGPRKLWSNL